jgi:hypothetical protein
MPTDRVRTSSAAPLRPAALLACRPWLPASTGYVQAAPRRRITPAQTRHVRALRCGPCPVRRAHYGGTRRRLGLTAAAALLRVQPSRSRARRRSSQCAVGAPRTRPLRPLLDAPLLDVAVHRRPGSDSCTSDELSGGCPRGAMIASTSSVGAMLKRRVPARHGSACRNAHRALPETCCWCNAARRESGRGWRLVASSTPEVA